MNQFNNHKHISEQFNSELQYIRDQVRLMGALVTQQLTDAINAVHGQEQALANQVLQREQQVNALEVAIDDSCLKIIARRQPAAGDLRLVITTIKTIAELERIGDVAEKIARMALTQFTQQQQPLLINLEALGRQTIQMLSDVLIAFQEMNVDAAVRIYREDKKVDQQYEALVRQLMTYMMADPRTIPDILDVLFCARAIERIGDRCQNICEFILFCVNGEDLRHRGSEAITQLLPES